MMEKMIFGRYIPVNSLLHKLDPRSKLCAILIFIFIIFIANNAITYGILAIFTFLALYSSNIPIKFLFNGLKFIFYLIVFTFLLHILFTREGDVLVDFGWLKIYERGLTQGIFISLRFLFLILITSLLTLTTTPIEITDGMESLMKPLRKIHFPVHELALMMSIALRFIPTLMDETDKIMKAQMARGVDFSHGSLKRRAQAIVPLLIPLFISSFKRAEELAVAMEARGYRGGEGRTKYRQLNWRTMDTIVILIVLSLGGILFIFRT
ncbi:energy-coupling factor transporter transmembrane component T family protein [Fervidibacillus halotolerans]|uniref:Energy-coupling factor transporter transmembrane protein EcfT n=1 Tax=Fervidibacillus halotolerans TaxID=2980027 RepID=A0A9E8RYM9_9BACI|nr:energy-coupling factor transporter transmembrane protein EcfT [Fervidibacillus halotolerans]WAA12423.1 energy-coupling factor transporter transmembrane protein EcfT [Fervidibacillus halotolerans]